MPAGMLKYVRTGLIPGSDKPSNRYPSQISNKGNILQDNLHFPFVKFAIAASRINIFPVSSISNCPLSGSMTSQTSNKRGNSAALCEEEMFWLSFSILPTKYGALWHSVEKVDIGKPSSTPRPRGGALWHYVENGNFG